MRFRRIVPLALVGLTLAAVAASAHPPQADLHNGCLTSVFQQGIAPRLVAVTGTVSYLARYSTTLPCSSDGNKDPLGNTETMDWASHAAACPPPPFVGAVYGVFCGPVIPAGGSAHCMWRPVAVTVPTYLVVGWDIAGGTLGMRDGLQNFAPLGPEEWVYGTYPQNVAWRVPNPHGVPARVMAFPTQTNPLWPGLTPTGFADQTLVGCR